MALRGTSRTVTLRSLGSAHVCRACREQSLQPKFINIQQQRFASRSNLPFTEKLRRKIWGTDNPPGLADPYGGPSILEKRKMRREAERRGEKYIEQPQIRQSQLLLPEDKYERSLDPEPRSQAEPQHAAVTEPVVREDQAKYEADESPAEFIGPEYTERPVMEAYTPAESTDGLKEIGRSGNWGDARPKPGDQYEPWLDVSVQPAATRAELMSCLHRALVECLACERTKDNPAQRFKIDCSVSERGVFQNTVLRPSAEAISGAIPLSIHQPNAVPTVIRNDQTDDTALEAYGVSGALGAEGVEKASLHQKSSRYYMVVDESFLSASLDVSQLSTSMILKRFSQLSGRRIPDSILNTAGKDTNSILLSTLLASFCKSVFASQRTTVAQKLLETDVLTGLGNVAIMSRRETPVDKEKDIGRWKVIERELTSRGLPVLGRLHP